MPKIYYRQCDCCGKWYKGQGIKFCSEECFKKNCVPHNKGKLSGRYSTCPICNIKFYQKLSEIKRGIKCCSHKCRIQYYGIWNKGLTKESDKRVLKNATALKGRKSTCYWFGKKRFHMLGDKHWFWKGGITPKNRLLRATPEYKQWRRDIFIRDYWTCQECGQKSVRIEAHHIKSFRDYPDLRLDINNGLTLCKSCHARKELKIRQEV